jgi:E3 ubiquitin-protein ligase TRIP12
MVIRMSAGPSNEASNPPAVSKKKPGRPRKGTQGWHIYCIGSGGFDSTDGHVEALTSTATPSTSSSSRRPKKTNSSRDTDVPMKDASEKPDDVPVEDDEDEPMGDGGSGMEDEDEEMEGDFDRDDDDDPFSGSYLGTAGGPPHGLSSTLRALTGMMSGVTSRLREILNNLKQKDDPSVQLIALQELSEILLVSTEDNLSGHFSPDQFVKELVSLMQPNEFEEENPEMMLLACRCIANLMEALPAATANVVYGGAVPVLCRKLLEIHYIDLAEQALSVSAFLHHCPSVL